MHVLSLCLTLPCSLLLLLVVCLSILAALLSHDELQQIRPIVQSVKIMEGQLTKKGGVEMLQCVAGMNHDYLDWTWCTQGCQPRWLHVVYHLIWLNTTRIIPKMLHEIRHEYGASVHKQTHKRTHCSCFVAAFPSSDGSASLFSCPSSSSGASTSKFSSSSLGLGLFC